MRIFNAAALVVCLVSPALAQETRGTFSGTVTDSSGAVITGATVTVTNVGTRTVALATTNSTGYYEVPLLLPGNYEMTVESKGFKKLLRSGLVLGLGEQQKIDLTLEVGNAAESVTVTAESPILDTSTTVSGKTLTTREVMDLPILANDILVQARMVAGVQTSGTTQYLSEGQIGGSSTSYFAAGNIGGNEWTMDGAPSNGESRDTAFTPHTDMVEEFKVETNSFDASFGHSTGLNINMSTKSGTNQVHGTSTYEYWSEQWAAAPYFIRQNYETSLANARAAGNTALVQSIESQPEYPKGHSNNFAGTFGGPVYIPKVFNGKNKLFFFFAYSGARDDIPARPSDINDTVPTAPERSGNFSDLLPLGAQYIIYDPLSVTPNPNSAGHYIRTPFPGNIVPQNRFNDPMYAYYNAAIPLPNNNPSSPTAAPLTNFLPHCQVDDNIYNAFDNKNDYNLNEKNRFFFRWNWSHYREFYGDPTCTGLLTTDDTRRNVSGVVDWTFAPTNATVIDVAIAANQFFIRNYNLGLIQETPSTVGLPSYMTQYCQTQNDCALPAVNLGGSYYLYNGSTFGRSLSSYPKYRTQGIKSNISHVMGKHTFRAGIDFRMQLLHNVGENGNAMGSFTFSNTYTQATDNGAIAAGSLGLSYAAFQLGIPTSMSVDNNTSITESNPYLGFYGMDTFRVTRNLTLTLGLRMEYEAGPTEAYNRAIGPFNPTAQLPIASAAEAAYAANPIPQLPASAFTVVGGDSYAGVNGVSPHLWQGEWMPLPRVAAAWQVTPKTVVRAGYGIYYDTLNVTNESANQSGFSCTQTNVASSNSGVTWNYGNPYNGVSILSNPFPSMVGGNPPCEPYGSGLGPMYQVGRGFTFIPYDREHPQVQRWRASVQRQLGRDMLVEATYWGQWSSDLGVTHELDALPAQYWETGLVRNNAQNNILTANVPNPFYIGNFASLQSSNPNLYNYMTQQSFYTSSTIQAEQLLRPFPQMNGLFEADDPLGRNRVKALEVDFNRRMSHGLTLNVSWSWLSGWDKMVFNNQFDPVPTWYPSNNSRPERVTINGLYELPFGVGKKFLNHGIPAAILGGWQLAATWEYQSGDVISWGNIYYYGNMANLASTLNDVPSKTISEWFNTSADFERNPSNQPASYSVRVFPEYINGVRGDKLLQTNANIHRSVRLYERMTLHFRADVFNVFNRSQMSDPDTNPSDSTFGQVLSETGSQNRFLQVQARIQF
ncbi:MAG: carboxypeptidase-like regulatory domain-containing protein [Bryobacteraceae bacterium]